MIEGVGPRYCPSIEDKIVRFPDKPRHQLFIEPCGLNTDEMYIQGFSSSLPEDVQIQMMHTIPGLQHAEMMRPALCHRIRLRGPHRIAAHPGVQEDSRALWGGAVQRLLWL